MFFLQVLLVTLQRSTMGQVEINLKEEDLNATLENSDNSTNYAGTDTIIGFVTHTKMCTPGKRPDPGSLTHYFLCVEVIPHVFREYCLECPQTLVYSSHTSECVSPYFHHWPSTGRPKPHPIKPPIGRPKPHPGKPPIAPPRPPPTIWRPPPPPPPPKTTPLTSTTTDIEPTTAP